MQKFISIKARRDRMIVIGKSQKTSAILSYAKISTATVLIWVHYNIKLESLTYNILNIFTTVLILF